MATIHSLVYQPEPSVHREPFHYTRIPAQHLALRAGHGIEGDRKAGHNPKRHLNIMSLEHIQALEQEGWHAAPGELGEQIVVRGLDVAALPPGTRIQLGESAVVEVTSLRTGCDWLAQIQGKNPADAAGRLGVMASVVASGSISVGAPVVVAAQPVEQS
jgi:MOSC domain-containing protein YiiM